MDERLTPLIDVLVDVLVREIRSEALSDKDSTESDKDASSSGQAASPVGAPAASRRKDSG